MYKSTLFLIIFFLSISLYGCVERNGYYNHGEESIISLICNTKWAGVKLLHDNGSTWQAIWQFNRNGTYTRTNVEVDKGGNRKEAKIHGQWSFADPSFGVLYFGGNQYWDIDELTTDKFSFYDRNGEIGDPYMSREYVEFTPYKEKISSEQ